MTPPLQALRPVLSVAMAVGAAHALGLHDAWWAAITAFMVMQATFGASLYRGLLRVVGTVCGAALGFVLGPALAVHPVAFVAALGAAAWGGLFAALLLRHSYAWVLALVTFIMVMCEALSNLSAPSTLQTLGSFATERVANIVVGTLACIVVAGLTELHPKLAWSSLPVTFSPTPPSGADHRLAAFHALNGAVAVVLLAIIALLYDMRSFSQAMVTTLAVLVVPLSAAASGAVGTIDAPGTADASASIDPTTSVLHRMAQRFAGCALAGVVAFALLPLIDGKPVWCQLVLVVGLWAGAWGMRSTFRWPYAATQFSVAFLMVFVQDRGWNVDTDPAAQRLLGVFAGIAVLTLVIYLLKPLHTQANKPTRNLP